MLALSLLAVFALCAAGAWVSYTQAKHAPWAPWAMGGLAAASGVVWTHAARRLSPEGTLAFSLAWDTVIAFCYYALPLILWGVRPTPAVLAGAGLVVAGLVLVHVGG